MWARIRTWFVGLPTWGKVVVVLVVLSPLGALAGEDTAPTALESTVEDEAQDEVEEVADPPEEEPEDTTHDESSLACDHFRNIARDISDGVLTVEEMREKLKEVDDNAVIATPRVQSAARSLLAAVTQDDAEGFLKGIRSMDRACAAAGH